MLSTHILSEVEATCDRALVIHRGRLVAQGSLAELRALGTAKTLLLELVDPDAKAEGLARALPGVESAQVELLSDGARRLTLTLARSPAEVAEDLVSALVLAGVRVRSVAPGKASLEEVFAALTEATRAAPSAGKQS